MLPAAGGNGMPVGQCLGLGITASQVSSVLGGGGQEPPDTECGGWNGGRGKASYDGHRGLYIFATGSVT